MERRVTRRMVMLLSLALALGLAATAWADQTHQDKTHGFSIAFPDGWKIEPAANKPFVVLALSPDGGKSDPYRENIQVAVMDLKDGEDWDAFAKRFAGGFKAMDSFAMSQELFGKGQAGGLNVRRFGGTYKVKGSTLSVVAFCTAKGKKGYAVVAHSVPAEMKKYLPAFEKAALSLRIK